MDNSEQADYLEQLAFQKRLPELTDQELRHCAERILVGKSEYPRGWADLLARSGERGETILVQALADRRCLEPADDAQEQVDRTVFGALTIGLAHQASRRILEIVLPWRVGTSVWKDVHAIECLASTGLDEAIASTCEALNSPRSANRAAARKGIFHASYQKQLQPAFRVAVSDAIIAYIESAPISADQNDGELCGLLMLLDRNRGLEALNSAPALTLTNPFLGSVLKVLNAWKVRLPTKSLRNYLAEAKLHTEPRWVEVWNEALMFLARISPKTVRNEIDSSLHSPNEAIRRCAVRALRESMGLPDPYALPWDELDFVSLPASIQQVVAVVEFDNEIKNGGLRQYFLNSYGDHSQAALDGLAAMNAKECHTLLNAAMKILGEKGTSPDRNARIESVGKLSASADEQLNQLEAKYFTDPDTLDLCIVRYMERNAAEMRKTGSFSPK